MPLADVFRDKPWTVYNLADFLGKADIQNFINLAKFTADIFLPILRMLQGWSHKVQSRVSQEAAKGQV